MKKSKKKIRIINPNITDELLELLYEYMLSKLNYCKPENVNECSKYSSVLAHDKYYIKHLNPCVSVDNAKSSESL